MKPLAATLTCHVPAHATLRAVPAEIAQLRRNPGTWPGAKWPLSLLKHSDEQTVMALAVMLRGIAKKPFVPGQYRDWGVVAAPTLFGRDGTAFALGRYLVEGAWGINPHMIPHHTLHAVSGTISQALEIQGPNMGVSGGPNAAGQAFLVAATMIAEGRVPGVWIVLTGHEQEKLPIEDARTDASSPPCAAVALALRNEGGELRLDLRVGGDNEAGTQDYSLTALRETLDGTDRHDARWALPGIGWLTLRQETSLNRRCA